MDRVLALITERMPCPAARIEAELVEKELTAIDMSVENIAVAHTLARPFRSLHDCQRPQRPANGKKRRRRPADRPLDQAAAVMAAVDMVKKEIYFHGLTTVEQIHRAVVARCGNRASATWCAKSCF